MKKIFVSTVLGFVLALGLAFAQSGGGFSGGVSGGASGGFGGVSGGSGGMTTSGNTVADALSSNPQFSTFVSLLQQAGLYQTLQSGNYTVFAPTNDAFNSLPAGQLSALKNNTSQLTQVLNNHIVRGEKSASDLATTNSLTTMEGGTLNITGVAGQVASGGAMSGGVMSGGVAGGMSGGVAGQGTTSFMVNNASISGSTTASNGIIYAVNTVLMPTNMNVSGGAASGGVSGGIGMSGGISLSGGASGGVSGGF